MVLPPQVEYRLLHFKTQMLHLVAARVFSVVLVCQIFGVSRQTFYKYRRLAEAGTLGDCKCAPHRHGRTTPATTVERVLAARQAYPTYGKKRLASVLRQQGIPISANTVQRILRAHRQLLVTKPRRRRTWQRFEAIAPNVIWTIDICYLYTKKRHGFDLYLISILDDHSRKVVASGVFARQTVSEVAAVLKSAILAVGIPQTLVCDNGKQFTCGELRRLCHRLGLELDYAPKYYPQYKGKIERFFRTAQAEMPRAETATEAELAHAAWIEVYNHTRLHSAVLDSAGGEHPPQFRFAWKASAARPFPAHLNPDEVFTLHATPTGPTTRLVRADHSISYRTRRFFFPHLSKGDRVEIHDTPHRLEFRFQSHLLETLEKAPGSQAAACRKAKADGSILFQRRRIPLNLPKGTQVLIVREGQDQVFYVNHHIIFKEQGQFGCQPPI
ncbi:MAG TPA: DDE-type integrase/transposase/recombinase [Acidobacteriota bacterium]|nr:DDE-type integrase/transposase/recombinase [Acidobacteriota bacterium]